MVKIMKSAPSTTQRVIVEQSSKKSIALSTPSFLSLARKSGKSDISLTVLEQVYARGLLGSIPSSKNTPEQQAFHRVESFIHRGKAYELDQDLISETPKVPDGAKHMYIIKNAIKNHKERNQNTLKEASPAVWVAGALGAALGRAVFGGQKKKVDSTSARDAARTSRAQEKIKKEKYQARQIDALGGKSRSRPAQISARLARAQGARDIRTRGQEQAAAGEKKMGLKPVDYTNTQTRSEYQAARAKADKGASYGGEQTPEQKAAMNARQQRLAGHSAPTSPSTGSGEPKSRMSSKQFLAYIKQNPNKKIRGGVR